MSSKTRIAKLRNRLAEYEADAFLVTGAVNRRYISGFTGSAGWLVITSDQAFLLTDFRYVQQVKRQAPDFTLIEGIDPLDSLGELLSEIQAERVAFETEHTTVKDQTKREQHLPAVTWVPTERVVEWLRITKDDEELREIERAVAVADDAFTYIVDRLTGRTEREVAFDLEMYMRKLGAERLSFPSIVASGPQGALPHAVPSDRTIGPGDLVTLDFGAVVNGYCSDMTRTVAVGRVDERQRELYALVKAAQERGVTAVRAGRLGNEVDAEARRLIDQAGYVEYFGHGLGHGVGLEIHESPRLSKRGEDRLAPGMVTSVEPGIYIPEWGGIRIEDLVVVEDDGCRVLTRSPKELIVVK